MGNVRGHILEMANPTQLLHLGLVQEQGESHGWGVGGRVGSWWCTAIEDPWGGFMECGERGEEF